jgi:hypothetical protein
MAASEREIRGGERVRELLAPAAVLARQVELRLHVGAIEVAADRAFGVRLRAGEGVRRFCAAAAGDHARVLARRGPPRRPLRLGHDADHRIAHFAHQHRTAEALQDAREEFSRRVLGRSLQLLGIAELLAQHVSLRQRDEELRGRAERDGDALVFLEIEAADAELGIELRDHTRAAPGHEEALAFVVRQPDLDLLGALDRIALRIGERRVLKRAGEALVIAVAFAQRLFDGRPQVRRMLGQAADLLEDLQALRPGLALLERVAEETEERVGLRALLRLAQRLRGGEERVDVGGIALDLVHPERLEIVELLLLNQSIRVFAERHERGIVVQARPRALPDRSLRIADPRSPLVTHLHERFEHVERKLLGVHDVPQVMHRRAALFDVGNGQVVLPQELVCFVLRHGFPFSVCGTREERDRRRCYSLQWFGGNSARGNRARGSQYSSVR